MNDTWQRPRGAHLALGAAFSLAFLFLTGWLIHIPYMTTEDRRTLAERAERQQTVSLREEALRGPILDARGRPLATTVEAYDVYADPKLVHQGHPDAALERVEGQAVRAPVVALGEALFVEYGWKRNCRETAERLSAVLGTPAEEIVGAISEKPESRFVCLKRRVDRQTKEAVEKLRLWGVGTSPSGKRCYPVGSLASQLVGAVGVDNQGLGGFEYLFDEQLSGSSGQRTVQKDGRGRPIWILPEGYKPAQDGEMLVLTLDLTIQSFVDEALAKQVKKFRARGGSAIVMDPQTGAILAMANYPTFEPSEFAEADGYAKRNRMLTDPYEPGSTFKCFIAAAALEGGYVRKGETIFCHNGVYRAPGRPKPLTDSHPYGNLSFEYVVVKSSNIGMGILGLRMGNAKLCEAMRRFGFGQKTGVQLPGEDGGMVKPLEKWSSASTTSVTMGYEVLATPLQIVTAFSSIANGGELLKPRIVKAIYGPDGKLVADWSSRVVVGRPLKQETADYMRRNVLRAVVTDGTGKPAAIKGYRVFGKTGTAKKMSPDGRGYSDRLYVGSFIGAAPLEHPRVVVMVLLDEPDKSLGYYGSTVAAPAVKEIMEKTLSYMRIEPDDPSRLARAE